MHDPRIGRFFAVDPLTAEYPWFSPYQFSGNSTILSIELEGMESAVELNYQEASIKIERDGKGKFVVHQDQLSSIGPGGYGHNWNTSVKSSGSKKDGFTDSDISMEVWCDNCRSTATGEPGKGAMVTIFFPKIQVTRSYEVELEREVLVEGDLIKGSKAKYDWKSETYDKLSGGDGTFTIFGMGGTLPYDLLYNQIKGWAQTYATGDKMRNASLVIRSLNSSDPNLINAAAAAATDTGVPISVVGGSAVQPDGSTPADIQGIASYQQKVKTKDAVADKKMPDTIETETYTETRQETLNPVVIKP